MRVVAVLIVFFILAHTVGLDLPPLVETAIGIRKMQIGYEFWIALWAFFSTISTGMLYLSLRIVSKREDALNQMLREQRKLTDDLGAKPR